MRANFFIIFIFSIFINFSCSSKKNVLLLQDLDLNNIPKQNYTQNTIKKDDILDIKVLSRQSELSALYNTELSEKYSNDIDILRINGYLVDNEGSIYFPSVGNIVVFGKTTSEVETIIYNKLLDLGQLKNHSVKVRIINSRITVLGEVNRPGTYDFFDNNLNINEALGMAGGLTITSERSNLKLIRENSNGKINVGKIDLTSNYLSSEFYQLKSGDVLIVSPNTTKIKSAGIIGNSGTLISLLSFILTSIILITN